MHSFPIEKAIGMVIHGLCDTRTDNLLLSAPNFTNTPTQTLQKHHGASLHHKQLKQKQKMINASSALICSASCSS